MSKSDVLLKEVVPVLVTAFNCLLLEWALFSNESGVDVIWKLFAVALIVMDYILIRLSFHRGGSDMQAFIGAKFVGQIALLVIMDFSALAAFYANMVSMFATNIAYIAYLTTKKSE